FVFAQGPIAERSSRYAIFAGVYSSVIRQYASWKSPFHRMIQGAPMKRMFCCGRQLSFRLPAPDEDMQTAGDDRSLSPLIVERLQPGAALGLGNHAGLDGRLGAAVGHAGIEALQMGLERKEAARSDVYEAGSLEEQRQLPD